MSPSGSSVVHKAERRRDSNTVNKGEEQAWIHAHLYRAWPSRCFFHLRLPVLRSLPVPALQLKYTLLGPSSTQSSGDSTGLIHSVDERG